MRQLISKKIFIYLFIFLILSTFSNKNISELNFMNNEFEIVDWSRFSDKQIEKDLSKLKNQNLFFLKKEKVLSAINDNKLVESFFVFKRYPSDLIVKIEKTKFLAVTKKNGLNFFLGSNGNLINSELEIENLPFIFGDVEVSEFLKLKRIIDNSNYDYNQIDKLYYYKSKRWDIETKNGLYILLPTKKVKESFEILLRILKNENLNKIKKIDLRQDNQVVLDEKY